MTMFSFFKFNKYITNKKISNRNKYCYEINEMHTNAEMILVTVTYEKTFLT